MEKFYRQDNLKITFGPKPGKGVCLEFRSSDPVNRPELRGNQREVLKDIVSFITGQVQWRDAPLHKRVQAAHPFIQGQSEDWLLIEFWCKPSAAHDVCLLLAGKFDFEFECEVTLTPELVAEAKNTKARSDMQTVYSYFTLREWKIMHLALQQYFILSNARVVDQEHVTEDEVLNIRTKLPSASGI